MRFISTTTHGVLDYLVGMLLIAGPWLLPHRYAGSATWLPVLLGSTTIVYSLFTDYRMGLIKVIRMPIHLVLDFLSGLLLACSPWLFGFKDSIYLPYLIVGIIEIIVSITTRLSPSVKGHNN